MARFRVSAARTLAVAALSIAGCGQAGAQAPAAASGLTAPAGWQALPEVARAAADAAKGEGLTVATEAWGETARGCYAVWLSLAGGGASVEHVLAGLAAEKLEPTDLVNPDGAGIVAFAFARPPYTGRMRARIAEGRVTALACFANQREPVACEAACTTVLGGLP